MAGGATFSCNSCGKQYPWKPELAGKKAKCKCGAVLAIPAKPQAARAPARAVAAIPAIPAVEPIEESQAYRCPACKADLSPGSAICISCGYNLQTGEYVNTQVDTGEDDAEVAAPKKKKKKKAAAAAASAATGQPSATGWIGMGKTKKERDAAVAANKSSTIKQVTIVLVLAVVVVGAVFGAKIIFKSKAGAGDDPALANLPGDDAEAMRRLKNDDPVEAKQFIESHETRSLGITWTRGKALGMIQRWYEMGVVKVWAFQGQISTHVLLELPQDPEKRKVILDWSSTFEDPTLQKFIKDVGQKYVILHMH
jgi:hypothetical protein